MKDVLALVLREMRFRRTERRVRAISGCKPVGPETYGDQARARTRKRCTHNEDRTSAIDAIEAIVFEGVG